MADGINKNTIKEEDGESIEKRNEIIRIFRKYARLGLTECTLNPIQIYKKIDVLCASHRSMLDMLAVYDTLRLLELNEDRDTLESIFVVYLDGRAHRLTKHEMGRRVSALASKCYCDERTVYRRLKKARELYAKIRKQEGLITDGAYSEKFNFQK